MTDALRFLLDTDTVSYFLQGRAPVVAKLRAHRAQIALSAIVVAELAFGLAKSSGLSLAQITLVEAFLQDVPVLGWDREAARTYGPVRAALEASGQPIGERDTMIAAHAVATGLTLVTNNTRHFSRVRKLLLENWLRSKPVQAVDGT